MSLVPLVAIALSMLAAFPIFTDTRQQIIDLLFRNFAPEVACNPRNALDQLSV